MTEGAPAPRPDTSALELSVGGAVGRITLARPDTLNALNQAALEELVAAASWFDGQSQVKVVVVAGMGRAFSSGFDLAEAAGVDLAEAAGGAGGASPPERSARAGRAMADAVGAMTAITVAAVRGHCIGGGVVLAAACDLRLAADGATFRIPEVDLGVPLYWTGIPRLVRELGPALTKELVLTGRTFDAGEAHRLGFLNRVVPDGDLDREVETLAAQLASKSALVLRVTKEQVEAAAPSVPAGDGGPEADVAGFAAAFADPESRAMAASYAGRRRRR